MKKSIIYAMIAAVAVSLAACGNKEPSLDSSAVQTETAAAEESSTEETASDASGEAAEPNNETEDEDQTFGRTATPLTIDISARYEGEWDDQGPIITADSATIHILDDGYEELKKVLDQYNEDTWQSVYSLYTEHLAYANEDFFPDDIELFISREIEVTRADSRVLSFRNTETSYTGGAHGSYYSNGETFDAATGKRLELNDIVTDYDRVYEMVLEYLDEHYEDDAFFPEYKEWLHEMFYNPEQPMSSPLEWSIEAEGVTILFNPYVIGPWASGTFEVEIPYAGNEDLFVEDYVLNLSNGVIRKLGRDGRFTIDSDRDGTPETYTVETSLMTDEYETELTIRSDAEDSMDAAEETKEGRTDAVYADSFLGHFTDAYLVTTKTGFYYLYAEFQTENDFRSLYLIDLNAEEGEAEPFTQIGSLPEAIYGHFVADAGQFALYSRVYTLGTYNGCRWYEVGEDGIPVTKDDRYRLITTGADWDMTLTSSRDLVAAMIDAETGEKTDEKLPKGTIFRPFETDGETVMEFVLEDGRHCELPLKRNDDGFSYSIRGISEYDCFENLPYAG